MCEAKLDQLEAVSDWVEQYREMWSARLDSLENYLEELQSPKKSKKHKKDKKKKKHGTKE